MYCRADVHVMVVYLLALRDAFSKDHFTSWVTFLYRYVDKYISETPHKI